MDLEERIIQLERDITRLKKNFEDERRWWVERAVYWSIIVGLIVALVMVAIY